MEKLVIVDIKKEAGNKTTFKLSDGKDYDYSSLLSLVEAGQVNNVVAEYRNGVKVLQYDPNSMLANDLYNVPENLYEQP
ncbi:MAG: DUF3892 domain-containing protein [Syntrophomonas sp.]